MAAGPSTSRQSIQLPSTTVGDTIEAIISQYCSDVGSTTSVSDTIEAVISQYCHQEAENETNDDNATEANINWSTVSGSFLKTFDFTPPHVGPHSNIIENYLTKSPVDFFEIFLGDDVLSLIVTETNRYAHQVINKGLSEKSRVHRWKDTNSEEIKTFFGICLWMGLSRYPKMADYWRKSNLYSNKISEHMPRNRFELLLRMLHFSNNEEPSNDRLSKLRPFLDLLVDKFKEVYIPEREVCIDETLVPFRGRLAFKQYIKDKRFKFGIKLYKLCCKGGYTYDLQVYCGKDSNETHSAPTKVVLSLMEPLLDQGRVLFTDNYYTSVALAHELLKRNTHLVGTLRKNRKMNPKEVITKNLKRGEVIANESNTGVVVLKWQDKRDVLCLSTKHTAETKELQRRGETVHKPLLICDYNNSKSFIDLSDQLKAYSAPLRKGIKWYRKLVFELLLGTAVVNAYILYRSITKGKISITEFREKIVEGLLNMQEVSPSENETENHVIEEVKSKERRRCVTCYEKIASTDGRKIAQLKAQKSRFHCLECNKFFCLSCYFDKHNSKALQPM